jgi:hypothetical protein
MNWLKYRVMGPHGYGPTQWKYLDREIAGDGTAVSEIVEAIAEDEAWEGGLPSRARSWDAVDYALVDEAPIEAIQHEAQQARNKLTSLGFAMRAEERKLEELEALERKARGQKI